MNPIRGYASGICSAVFYGCVPLFTLPLVHQGINNGTILIYRFLLATLVVYLFMRLRKESLAITRKEFFTLLELSIYSDGSAVFLYASYQYMSSGVATTLRFMYPVITTLIMVFIFHEKKRLTTFIAIAMTVIGVAFISMPSDAGSIPLTGLALIMISACSNALYFIRVFKSCARTIPGMKLTFYILALGSLLFVPYTLMQGGIQWISGTESWISLLLLVVVSTVLSNLTLVMSIQSIGSTTTSILGALEPLTAVFIGIAVYGEQLTRPIALGILLIIPAVLLIILSNSKGRHRLFFTYAPQRLSPRHILREIKRSRHHHRETSSRNKD